MLIYKFLNPMIDKLLASPFHAVVSGRLMTVSYCGRRSGKAYRVPVSYYREQSDGKNYVYCFTNGVWWRNFIDGADVVLRIGGQDYSGHATAETADEEEQIAIMKRYFKAVPSDKKFYGVRCDSQGEPITELVANAASTVVMIKTCLS